jgi:hypothetical protein
MRWEDEPYIRFYKRNTPEWCVLSWKARGLLGLLLREVDRAGLLELGKLGLKAVAVAVRAPWDEIEAPLAELLTDGMVGFREDLRVLVIRNFVDAQEAPQSDRARKRLERERARDLARAKSLNVTAPSENVTRPSENVTERHDESNGVTSGHSVQCSAEISSAEISSAEQPARPTLPGLVEIETAIRRYPLFANVDAHALAEHHAGLLMTSGQRLAWLIRAIDECAGKHIGQGLKAGALQGRLDTFMRNARAPRNEVEQPVRKFVEADEKPPTDEELDARRKAMDERTAKLAAEKRRREELGQPLSGGKK